MGASIDKIPKTAETTPIMKVIRQSEYNIFSGLLNALCVQCRGKIKYHNGCLSGSLWNKRLVAVACKVMFFKKTVSFISINIVFGILKNNNEWYN